MIDLSQCRLKLVFKFVPLDEKYMNLTVVTNLETVEVQPADTVVIEVNATMPSDIMLYLSGKGANDTIVSDDGKILADKHVELVAVEIDRLPVIQHFVQNWPVSNNRRTSYFGFNETVVLELHEQNPFYFVIKNQ